jgi:hypothetical protein
MDVEQPTLELITPFLLHQFSAKGARQILTIYYDCHKSPGRQYSNGGRRPSWSGHWYRRGLLRHSTPAPNTYRS